MPRANNRGGKRDGAGRKPGPTSLALDPSASVEIPAYSGDSPPWHEAASRFLASGFSMAEVGRRLHRDEATIARFRDEHPELIAAAIDRLTEQPHELWRQLVPDAAGVYRSALTEPEWEHGHKLQAAGYVMDRAYGRTAVAEGGSPPISVNITFVSATQVVTNPDE